MKKHGQSGLSKSYILKGYLFLVPATLVYLIFAVIPFFDNFILSFHSWTGFGDRVFTGLSNYINAFQDQNFLRAIWNSVYLGVISSIFSVIIGVLFAWLLLYISRRAGGVFRTILFSPSMIPAVITALIFSFVYEPEFGILNKILEAIGLGSLQHAWLTNRATVLNSIVFVSAWKQVGLTMVLCFAGMQGIPKALMESAFLEGASDWTMFRKIILPLTMSFVQLSAIFALMSGLKIYDTVLALTNGGPGKFSIVMPMWIMQNAFSFNHYGYGAAMSVIFVLIVLAGMIITKKIIRGDAYEL
ncbi:sugar ABC transporter permease [uncultured Sphaerochaeta sp.]|uniref:carbohydrate ABC transporter permease n=1 Tax=uncultured Sphaerochaeta sp. TaxID=886478 RepID=UPI002A0A97C6|nr:sugar ABC transporter permease [uncultured Sphaerochaeta sp.]